MRMHRGSSKGTDAESARPETLPLSASLPERIFIEFEIARAGRSESVRVEVAAGSSLRAAIRTLGHAPEGCAVLDGERPLPLDTPIVRSTHLTLVPTFSGG
jgi:sulfur carrier protein ThiS